MNSHIGLDTSLSFLLLRLEHVTELDDCASFLIDMPVCVLFRRLGDIRAKLCELLDAFNLDG